MNAFQEQEKSGRYNGEPCCVCGGVERYSSNRMCVACKKKYDRDRHATHREDHNIRSKKYDDTHRDQKCVRGALWRKEHPEYIKAWLEAHPEYKRNYMNNYVKERCIKDPLFRLKKNLRSKVSASLKEAGYRKKSRTADILGCSFEDLRKYIEALFWPGMTWSNYGNGWVIDHISPLVTAIDERGVLEKCHYLNLQPLWDDDNAIKSDRLDWTIDESKHQLPKR